MKQQQLVWLPDQEAAAGKKKIDRGKYTQVAKPTHHTLHVAGDPPAPGSELLLPTFISPGQRKLLWTFVCSALCFGVFVGTAFILAVQGWSGSGGDDALAESGNLTLPSNASDNCTLTYDPDDISELMREAYVRTFFNVTCLATNGTGDPCDLHLAEEYTYRMFSALRFDRLVTEFLAFVVFFSLAQIGGIPRPTDWNGMFFWLAWMATMLAQYVVILCALILQVFSFLGVRTRLSPCLVQVDGTALLDFYAMCTFATQPELVIKATMLFVHSFLLSLGMLVFDGSREWPWLSKLEDEVTAEEILITLTLTPNPASYGYSEDPNLVSVTLTARAAEPGGDEASWVCATTVRNLVNKLTARFPRAARFLQSSPIPRVKFVENATGPIMPKDKRFKARLSLSLCHYHVARTIVLGASFSMWAVLGNIAAAPGVASAWVLALLVAVLTAMVPWARLDQSASFTLNSLPYIMPFIIFCPLLSASAILPLSALFMLVVQLAYFLGRWVLEHIGPGKDGNEQVWVELPECLANRGCCKWTDALAGPTRTCLSWVQSTSIFSYVDGVLGRPQGIALAFTSTSYATLAGGLSCFWVLLALAPVASHIAWTRARSLISSEGAVAGFANNTTLEVGDVDGLTGEWSWVWDSLMAWLWLGAAIVLCCCAAGKVAEYLATETEAHFRWGGLPLRARWLLKTAFTCAVFALIIFIFTASQTADAKERIATTYASSSVALSGLQLHWNGALPSFDELVKVLNDPAAALSSVVQRISNLSSYAKFDPAYFSEGVQALTAINLVLSFVKLLATYGRKLFALMDAAKSILKTYTGHEAASEGDDGTVQVCETMTDLKAIAILGLLNKREVKIFSLRVRYGEEEVSFAKLVLQEEHYFDFCNLGDGDLPGLVALVTHPEMAVKLRLLSLAGNRLVTAEAWEKALTDMLTKGSLTVLSSLNLRTNGIGIKGCAVIAKALRVNSSLTTLSLGFPERGPSNSERKEGIGYEEAKAIGAALAINGSLTILDLEGNSIGNWDCEGNPGGTEGGVAIAEALRVNGSLKILNLARNQLGNEGAKAIGAALAVNGSLTKLDLRDNGLDGATRTSLTKAVSAKTGFTLVL